MKDFLVPMIIAFVISIVYAVSSRYHAQVDENGGYILKYPKPIKIFGAALLAVSIVGTSLFMHKFLSAGTASISELLFVACLFIGLCLSLFLEFNYAKFYINEDYICSNTPWSKTRSIYWKDVNSIKYSTSFRWFTIKDERTKPIHISEMVSGIDKFMEYAKAKTKDGIYQKLQDSIK